MLGKFVDGHVWTDLDGDHDGSPSERLGPCSGTGCPRRQYGHRTRLGLNDRRYQPDRSQKLSQSIEVK